MCVASFVDRTCFLDDYSRSLMQIWRVVCNTWIYVVRISGSCVTMQLVSNLSWLLIDNRRLGLVKSTYLILSATSSLRDVELVLKSYSCTNFTVVTKRSPTWNLFVICLQQDRKASCGVTVGNKHTNNQLDGYNGYGVRRAVRDVWFFSVPIASWEEERGAIWLLWYEVVWYSERIGKKSAWSSTSNPGPLIVQAEIWGDVIHFKKDSAGKNDLV